MPFPWMAAAAVGSSLIGGAVSAFGAARANRQSAASNLAQRNRQEFMANTAYRRGMADMKAAGLNPILAYKQGGAATPSGTSYTAQNELAGVGSALESGVNSALGATRLKADLKQIQASTENTKMDTKLKDSTDYATRVNAARAYRETENLLEAAKQIRANTAEATQRTSNEVVRGQILRENLTSAKAAATQDRITDQLYRGEHGDLLKRFKLLREAIGLGGVSLPRRK